MNDFTAPRDVTPLPEQIGPYRILQVLGEGGMGIVYEAEETGAVRRRVALKVVRSGLDSREIVARFDAERQALAVMNHPAIAKVLHAGATATGQPYFAMELVKGLPITEYCDLHRLSVRRRVELFIAVCRAIQHAHQKGVIHRDLKPSNVLVAEQDGIPQPKIIDFGIAKALGSQLTERTLVTRWGEAMGTAAYMSPEQADTSAIDIDTRSDIYSLGVMLFELLVGCLPVDPAKVGVHAFLARLAAGDTPPPTPSAKLQTLGNERDVVASTRHTDATILRREIKGDLDWIIMKAMEPERSRRYETANGLANDLQRHLLNEPVVARPRSTRYRVAKFIRRHRVGVTMAVAVSLAVVASAVVANIGFLRARNANREAQAVTTFLVELFQSAAPGVVSDSALTAREILERGANRISGNRSMAPLIRASVMFTLGTVEQDLGLLDQSRDLLTQALTIRERELGPNDLLVAEVLNSLGDVARDQGEHNDAERYYQRALQIRQRKLGKHSIEYASTLSGLASLRYRQKLLPEADSLYQQVIALDQSLRNSDDPRTGRDLRGLGAVYYSQGRLEEADSLSHKALELQERTLGQDNFEVAGTCINLGAIAYRQGKIKEALQWYLRAQPIMAKALPANSRRMATLLNNLGEAYWKLKQPAVADSLLQKALEIKLTMGSDSTDLATTYHALAGAQRDEGRTREAERNYRLALAIRERFRGTGNADLKETLSDYAKLLQLTGRPAEAKALQTEADTLKP